MAIWFGWTPAVLDALTGPEFERWADNLERAMARRNASLL